jgi:hypothetical protein
VRLSVDFRPEWASFACLRDRWRLTSENDTPSVILTGDDEIARRPLLIGPAEVFRA